MAFRERLRVLLWISTATYYLNFCQDGANALMWLGIMLKSSGTWLELIPYFRNSFSFKFYDFGNPTY